MVGVKYAIRASDFREAFHSPKGHENGQRDRCRDGAHSIDEIVPGHLPEHIVFKHVIEILKPDKLGWAWAALGEEAFASVAIVG